MVRVEPEGSRALGGVDADGGGLVVEVDGHVGHLCDVSKHGSVIGIEDVSEAVEDGVASALAEGSKERSAHEALGEREAAVDGHARDEECFWAEGVVDVEERVPELLDGSARKHAKERRPAAPFEVDVAPAAPHAAERAEDGRALRGVPDDEPKEVEPNDPPEGQDAHEDVVPTVMDNDQRLRRDS